MPRKIVDVEVDGRLYLIMEVLGLSYAIRDLTTGDMIGAFLLNEEGTALAATDGIDLPLTICIAKAALRAIQDAPPTLPPEELVPDEGARSGDGLEDARRTAETEPPPPTSRRT